jgi:hypothetical protein
VLSGYAGQMLVSFCAFTIDGAADRAIGQLLLALGRVDEAIERLAAARALEESFGADLLATRTTYWQALALARRDGPGDHETARQLRLQASSRARQLGMTQLEGDIDALAAGTPPAARR